jgi:hypothetical protein
MGYPVLKFGRFEFFRPAEFIFMSYEGGKILYLLVIRMIYYEKICSGYFCVDVDGLMFGPL